MDIRDLHQQFDDDLHNAHEIRDHMSMAKTLYTQLGLTTEALKDAQVHTICILCYHILDKYL